MIAARPSRVPQQYLVVGNSGWPRGGLYFHEVIDKEGVTELRLVDITEIYRKSGGRGRVIHEVMYKLQDPLWRCIEPHCSSLLSGFPHVGDGGLRLLS